jgi:2-C-methyl-D-erythritol 4-phosphate cytidylyltransferase
MNVAIIVAAGRGMRMGGDEPKQFQMLAGVPLVIHALRRFDASETIHSSTLVVPEEWCARASRFREDYGLNKLINIVAGGSTRSESVWYALQSLDAESTGVVAVHDGARPFVTSSDINRVVRHAEQAGAAILTTAATDTIKEVIAGRVTRTLTRTNLRHALTPQCFRYELLRRAYTEANAQDLRDATDDSALVERLGAHIYALDGDTANIKITRPEDWTRAEIIIESQRSKIEGQELEDNT